VVAGARSRWATRRKLALSELAHEPWILDPSNAAAIPLIATAFRAHGLELPRRNVTSFSLHVRTYLLATGRFLAIMPDSTLRFCAKPWSIKALPIDLSVPPQKVAIFTLKNRTLSPAVKLFIQCAREVTKPLARKK
jgi:DNA-binding transcriptional LysR family regulator